MLMRDAVARLDGRNLLAAAVNELLDAPGQGQAALIVQEALVASVEPAACRRSAGMSTID